MVRAILDGRKTVTRRIIKLPTNRIAGKVPNQDDVTAGYEHGQGFCFYEKPFFSFFLKPPYSPGDILYVRETWQKATRDGYFYRADFLTDRDKGFIRTWRPSIHMPKEAARLFLRVTDVRVERLQDISDQQAISEGSNGVFTGPGEAMGSGWDITPCEEFRTLWDSTIKKAELHKYGWEANPWVWVIEFEQISMKEALKSES